jgi:hypothetical protein
MHRAVVEPSLAFRLVVGIGPDAGHLPMTPITVATVINICDFFVFHEGGVFNSPDWGFSMYQTGGLKYYIIFSVFNTSPSAYS